MQLLSTSAYQAMPADEVLAQLETGEQGLRGEAAAARLAQYGYNEIVQAKRHPLLGFLRRYWGPMPWLLELSIVLTLVLQHYTESFLIFALLSMNAVIGQLQARSSRKAVEMLQKQLEVRVKVLRDNKWTLQSARLLVPGDVVTLRLGDMVPADVYLLNGSLSVDQSALTGESLPVGAAAGAVAYSGSVVKRGEAKAVVLHTGAGTFFGKTAQLVKVASPQSKQAQLMLTIVRYMLYLGVAASLVVCAYGVYLQKDLLFLLSFIVIFLIGAIPVALPAVLTIVQAAGAMELSKKGVLVAKLDCVEDAASIDVFCFDKTGTITQNQLTVVDCVPFGDFDKETLIGLAAQACNRESMDLIDSAILAYAAQAGCQPAPGKLLRFVPFSPERKRTEAYFSQNDTEICITKGAVPTILALCLPMRPAAAQAVDQCSRRFSAKGCRALAVAVTKQGHSRFVGLLAIADPPRPDSKRMIGEIRALGIKPILITGDSAPIAREVAQQVGIGSHILRASEWKTSSHDRQLAMVHSCDGFAEVLPEDKYQIVKLLQESGHTVGMTGDGVNDAPALRQAELGTAVREATDVAKASASMVLTQKGLSGIIDAVIASRKTYQRMLTWVINKITKVVEVVALFTAGFFWLQNALVSLLGMSLLVFANDFVTMSIATDRVRSTAAPNRWNLRDITLSSLCLGLLFALADLLILWVGRQVFHLPFAQLQTVALLALVFNTQFRMLIVRERRHFWSSRPSAYLLAVNLVAIFAFALLGVTGAIIPAVSWQVVLCTLGMVAASVLLIDLLKYQLFRWFHV